MRSEKRRAIRLEVLNDLYRAYKTTRTKRKMIPLDIEMEDPETFYALEYLADKKLVYFKQTKPEYYIAKITPLGRTFLESELQKQGAGELVARETKKGAARLQTVPAEPAKAYEGKSLTQVLEVPALRREEAEAVCCN